MSIPIKARVDIVANNQPVQMRAMSRNIPVSMGSPNAVIGTGGRSYVWGDGLTYDIASNTVSVDTIDDAIEGESRPITSNGVYKEIGNIAILLGTI
jgi:hypothetical protein